MFFKKKKSNAIEPISGDFLMLRASAIETDVTVARAHARGDEVTNFYVAT